MNLCLKHNIYTFAHINLLSFHGKNNFFTMFSTCDETNLLQCNNEAITRTKVKGELYVEKDLFRKPI